MAIGSNQPEIYKRGDLIMRNIKIFCLITTFIVMIISLTGCGADNNATGGKSSLFGKYEFFTDEDMELFRMDELSLSINGNTYTLGMTKNEIEDMLGEKGEGYGHSASKGADSSSTGNQIIEPDSYEYYQSVNNYYYYPNNKMAVIYRSVQDGQETNNPAVLISVNNSALVDSEGFSPGIDMLDDVKEHVVPKYGDKIKEDITGSEVELFYNEFGEYVIGRGWVTGDGRPGGWKVYYAYDGDAINSITVGSRKAFTGDSNIHELWK